MEEYGAEYFAKRRMGEWGADKAAKTLAKAARVAAFGRETRVLEVGCGMGHVAAHLAGVVKSVKGLDRSAHALEKARGAVAAANVTFVEGDALEFESEEKYDVVLALAVFEHFDEGEQGRFLGRAATWLAPGGRLVLHVPITRSWSAVRRHAKKGGAGSDYTGDETHRAWFSPASLRASLTAGGFRVDREWIRYARWKMKEGWSRAALALVPRGLREKFAMEMMVSAVPETRPRG